LQAVLTKLTSTVESLQQLVGLPEAMLVADVIRGPVANSLSDFLDICGTARKTIKMGGRNAESLPDVKHLAAEIASSKKASALMQTVLATMAKASGSASR
jgi:hypothetical protein